MLTLKEMADCLEHFQTEQGTGLVQPHYLPPDLNSAEPASFCTDSRSVGPGDIFVCIAGNKVDGHDFASQAAMRGAIAIIAERDVFPGEIPPVAVLYASDSVKALGRLAAFYRSRVWANVVGITGSAGKTSSKEVMAAVLGVRGLTSKNSLNLNNQIGLPLSMLNASENAVFWVMEAGISEAHDMDELGMILRPDLALILNVGPVHLQGLEELGVANYKSRLLDYLSPRGVALVSADYPDLVQECRKRNCNIKYFSTKNTDADYYALYLGPVGATRGRYLLQVDKVSFELITPFRGKFGEENVAAIAGAAHLLGLKPEEIVLGFSGASLPEQRFRFETRENCTIIDDSYNANPLSGARMLEAASEIAQESGRPLVLVLGEMLELGSAAAEAHIELGRQMADSGAVRIFWRGGYADMIQQGLNENKYTGEFSVVQSRDEFRAGFAKLGFTSWVVLFKGSRSIKLEEFASIAREEFLYQLNEGN